MILPSRGLLVLLLATTLGSFSCGDSSVDHGSPPSGGDAGTAGRGGARANGGTSGSPGGAGSAGTPGSAGTDGTTGHAGSATAGGGGSGAAGGSTGVGGLAGADGLGGAGGPAGAPAAAGKAGAGGAVVDVLETILDELRADRDAALLARSRTTGWPVPVANGHLFVSRNLALSKTAGDHDAWAGTPMTKEKTFAWVVIKVADGSRYKFTDDTLFEADAWARSYTYDDFGEMSLVRPKTPHLDRHLAVSGQALVPRTLRVWIPAGTPSRVLYVHDGQNLFNPKAFFGGWKLQDTAPPGMMLVGIDNTPDRLDEYTHVMDEVGGNDVGGKGDAYAVFLKTTVRPLIASTYGEPGPVGLMGSSLGGLISFHVADHQPGEYAFAASLSGTMGWGSIGPAVHNQTLIERYGAHGHGKTVLYLDSGGSPGTCKDSDADGIVDDGEGGDNYCETAQMHDVLLGAGYVLDKDVFYWHEPGGQHNEAAWAARAHRPLGVFAGL